MSDAERRRAMDQGYGLSPKAYRSYGPVFPWGVVVVLAIAALMIVMLVWAA